MSNAAKSFFNPFGNWSDSMPNFMNTGMPEKMREQANRNMQTLSNMQQMCAETMQAMLRGAAKASQKNAQSCMETFRDACASKTPEEAQRINSAAMNNMVKECCGSAREAAEMSAKLAMKVIDMVDSMACEWNNCCGAAPTGKADKK